MLPGGVRWVSSRDVATVWLDRPEVRNAQTFATWASLAQVAAELPGSTRVVVLRGAGRDFSSGLDLRMLQPGGVPQEGVFAELLELDDAGVEAEIAGFQAAFTCWRALDAVVVAVVQGRAVGAGFQLALAADLRVLGDDAVLRMAEVSLGLVPDLGGTQRLLELVGYPAALELCATGRAVDATEAQRLGLTHQVVPLAELEGAVEALVASLLAVSPAAVRSVKRLLAPEPRRTPTAQLAAERAAQVPLLRGVAASR